MGLDIVGDTAQLTWRQGRARLGRRMACGAARHRSCRQREAQPLEIGAPVRLAGLELALERPGEVLEGRVAQLRRRLERDPPAIEPEIARRRLYERGREPQPQEGR